MLFVLFQLGHDRYALEASRVVEVLPLLGLKRLPQAPRGVAGIFVYRGQRVPAIDLCELTLGRPAVEHLSTRILLVQHHKMSGRVEPSPLRADRPGTGAAGEGQLFGLIVERATGTLRRDEKDFVAAGNELGAASFLGPVLLDEQGEIQLLDPQKLLDAGGQPMRLTHSVEVSDAPN